MGGTYGMYGEEERCMQGLDGETWGKESLGGPGRRWEDNIKMGHEEVGSGGMD